MQLTKLTEKYLDELKSMYLEYFPVEERKPFELMTNNDFIDVWLYLTDVKNNQDISGNNIDNGNHNSNATDGNANQNINNTQIGGFAFTLKGADAVLLDYFAVNKFCRGLGAGAKIIGELKDVYNSADGIYIEIERLGLGGDEADNIMRLRRQNFYFNNGFVDCGIFIKLMGVDMQLMYLPLKSQIFDYSRYTATYTKAIGEKFVRENIRLL